MKKKRWFRWWMVPLIIVLTIFGLGVYFAGEADRRFDAEVAACAAAGMPVTLERFRGEPVPADQNAAGHYQQAIRLKKMLPADIVTMVQIYDPTAKPEDLKRRMSRTFKGEVDEPTLRKVLVEWEPVFDAIVEGTRKPKLNWNRPWELGYEVTMPEYGELRTMATALGLDAQMRAKAGDVTGALARLVQSRTIGEQCFQEPILIAQLVGAATIQRTNNVAMKIALENRDDPKALTKMSEYFADEPSLPRIRWAFGGEVYFLATLPDKFASEAYGQSSSDYEPSAENMATRAMKIRWVRRSAQARILKLYREAWNQMPDDPAQWKESEGVLDDLDRKIAADKSFIGQVASIFPPVFAGIGQSSGNAVQRHRLGKLAIALIEERARMGRYPAALPKLGDLTVDVYTGTALKYLPSSDGFRLYSVGSNGTDDNGAKDDQSVIVEKDRLSLRR